MWQNLGHFCTKRVKVSPVPNFALIKLILKILEHRIGSDIFNFRILSLDP